MENIQVCEAFVMIIFCGYLFIAYFSVHSRTVLKYSSGFDLYIFARSGTSAWSGFGSINMEINDNITFPIVSAGVQEPLKNGFSIAPY